MGFRTLMASCFYSGQILLSNLKDWAPFPIIISDVFFFLQDIFLFVWLKRESISFSKTRTVAHILTHESVCVFTKNFSTQDIFIPTPQPLSYAKSFMSLVAHGAGAYLRFL